MHASGGRSKGPPDLCLGTQELRGTELHPNITYTLLLVPFPTLDRWGLNMGRLIFRPDPYPQGVDHERGPQLVARAVELGRAV
jgi:hypothetical protein